MATPGIALLLSFLEPATIPASPPKKAIKTSQIAGVVLERISDWASFKGVIIKYIKTLLSQWIEKEKNLII